MASARDRNVVSTWWFFLVPILEALPCIGTLFMLVWAFSGDNRSRQNYCKARLLWTLVVVALWFSIASVGLMPEIMKAAGYTKIGPVERAKAGNGHKGPGWGG